MQHIVSPLQPEFPPGSVLVGVERWKRLAVSGEVYRYFDVPAEEYAAFLTADSKGTYLNQQFKPRARSRKENEKK